MQNQITEKMIQERIYNQFIKATNQRKNLIGIEIEMPLLNMNKKAVNFNLIHKITKEFQKEHSDFQDTQVDYDGNIYALKNNKTRDILCYDCSYNNIEFAMGPEADLHTINDRFEKYYTFIKQALEKENHTITGMGINPYRKYNNQEPIPSERYMMLYHHLQSYKNYTDNPIQFHKYPSYGMFSSASQVQLDVHTDDLIDTINTFSKIEPYKALIFSNSLLTEENHDIICYRDILWEYSTHGINPRNIGMYDTQLSDISDLITYLQSLNMYCVMRNNSYINFPSVSLYDYYMDKTITGEKYNDGHYEKIDITPSIDDIKYLRPFKFINLTSRGTVEFRSVCTQPAKDSMTVAAFHLGLKENINNLKQLIEDQSETYTNEYTPTQLRKLLIQSEIPEYLDKNQLYEFTNKIVNVASDGLKQRGIGEEKFLKPLYERIKKQTNPAKDILNSLNNNRTMEELIKEYG